MSLWLFGLVCAILKGKVVSYGKAESVTPEIFGCEYVPTVHRYLVLLLSHEKDDKITIGPCLNSLKSRANVPMSCEHCGQSRIQCLSTIDCHGFGYAT